MFDDGPKTDASKLQQYFFPSFAVKLWIPFLLSFSVQATPASTLSISGLKS